MLKSSASVLEKWKNRGIRIMSIQVKPNMNNSKDMKVFATAKEAVLYLEEYTGGTSSGRSYDDKILEWIWIGKAKKL
tara:strand:+ start:285 stop:515 length:231 start_codon:yes stop_codon:yes gene_type:complete